jgi:hypothetical protein
MKEDMNVKNALMTLYQMGNDAEDCMLSLQTSLLYNTSTLLNDCRAKVEYIKKTAPQLSQIITKLAMDDLHFFLFLIGWIRHIFLPHRFFYIITNILEVVNDYVRTGDSRSRAEETFRLSATGFYRIP